MIINYNYLRRINVYKLILLFPLFLIGFGAKAHDARSEDSVRTYRSGWKGNSAILSLGVGFPNSDMILYEGEALTARSYSLSDVSGSPAFHAKMELYVRRHIGIGITANYSNLQLLFTENGSSDLNSATFHVLTYNARVNYHFLYRKKIDIYAGAGIGMRLVKAEYSTFSGPSYLSSGPVGFESTVGIRYLANGLAGFYLEAGIGRSLIQGGISINLKRRSG